MDNSFVLFGHEKVLFKRKRISTVLNNLISVNCKNNFLHQIIYLSLKILNELFHLKNDLRLYLNYFSTGTN